VSEVKKICSRCKEAKNVNGFYRNGKIKNAKGYYYTKRCKICHNKKCTERFQEKCKTNPDLRIKENKKTKAWKRKNPEKNREYNKQWKRKNPEKVKVMARNQWRNPTENYKKARKRKKQRMINELRDGYIRKLLGGSKFNLLIPAKREQIKLLRLCKKQESET
jgi:hypothetical protein